MSNKLEIELDLRVAEKVMGLEIVCDTVRWANFPWRYRDKESCSWKEIPSYSTDMNAAMEVIEKIKQNDNQEGWLIEINPEDFAIYWDGPIREFLLRQETMPMAVCLAALMVNGDGSWVDQYLLSAMDTK